MTKDARLFRQNCQDLNNDNGINGAEICLSHRMNRIKEKAVMTYAVKYRHFNLGDFHYAA